jgi:hypothetical protein
MHDHPFRLLIILMAIGTVVAFTLIRRYQDGPMGGGWTLDAGEQEMEQRYHQDRIGARVAVERKWNESHTPH